MPVTVGVYYSPEFQTYEHRQVFKFYSPGAIAFQEHAVTEMISLGPASVSLFDQIFTSLFEKTVTLENKPAHGEQISGVDAIIQPSIGRFNLVYPFHCKAEVQIEYQIVMYSAHEGNIGFWSAEGIVDKDVQLRLAFVWPKVLTQEAMREAASKFLIGFYDSVEVKNWIKDLDHSVKNSGEK